MRRRVKLFINESWLLIIAAVLFGGLLAFTNAAWEPKIKENETKKFNDLAKSLLEGASDFVPLDVDEPLVITGAKGKQVQVAVKRGVDASGQPAGWAFTAVGSGFADKIRLVVAVDANFENLAGFGVLSSNETPGFGDKINLGGPGSFKGQFAGAPARTLTLVKTAPKSEDEIQAISGATVTSQAVVDALNIYVVEIKKALTEKGLIQ